MAEEKARQPVFEFERVLGTVPARVFACVPSENDRAQSDSASRQVMAVAFSGGLDSSVLLHLAQAYALKNKIELYAFHIHHGLNTKADAWLSHCKRECESLHVHFDARRVTLDLNEGEGIEAAARRERYQALTEMCRLHGINLLLTAHHEDDQVETVLLQLMRGAGVAGLSGMEVLGAVPDEPDEDSPRLLRPLLAVSRQALEAWAGEKNLLYVEDDSNIDTRYTRNAIRIKVTPVLSAIFPGFGQRVARSARHAQSAQRLLNQLAEMDWESCREGMALNVLRMASLGEERFDNLLRFWLARHGLRMPSTAWMNEARSQLLEGKEDAQVKLALQGGIIRRYQNQLFFYGPDENHQPGLKLAEHGEPFVWRGESRILLEAFAGELVFECAEKGIDEKWLRAQSLCAAPYYGKTLIKVDANRPTRSLKAHYQEKQIPPWERQYLPLLYAGEKLLFAAGVGMSADLVGESEKRIWISWGPLASVNDRSPHI